MSDTVRTETELLEIFKDAQKAGAITAQDMRDLIVSVTDGGLFKPAAAQFQSQITQTAASPNVPQVASLEFETFKEDITHSTTVNNSEITVNSAGIYEIYAGVSIWDAGGGGGIVSVFIEENLGGSPEWFSTDAAVRRDGSNVSAGFASIMHMDRHVAGDKFRVSWVTDTTNARLEAFTPGVGTHPATHPLVPSIDVHIKKVSV